MKYNDVTEVEQVLRNSLGQEMHALVLSKDNRREILGQIDGLRARIAELEGARAKASAEVADLREQCAGMESREIAGSGIIIEQTATIDRQARELERLRKAHDALFNEANRLRDFSARIRHAHHNDKTMSDVVDSVSDALELLDRASPAQAEPQAAGTIYRGTACAIARDADAVIARQASELERLRDFADTARIAIDEPYMADVAYKLRRAFERLDRAAPARAEPQDADDCGGDK